MQTHQHSQLLALGEGGGINTKKKKIRGSQAFEIKQQSHKHTASKCVKAAALSYSDRLTVADLSGNTSLLPEGYLAAMETVSHFY